MQPMEARETDGVEVVKRGRRRNLWVIGISSVVTLLVMAGVIVLGQQAREREDARRAGQYGLGDVYGDPYRRTPWPEDGCEPDRENPPRLVFDLPPEGVAFGAVKQGVKLERDVTFRNEGRGPLCIRTVDVACGCLKADLLGDTRKFEPGASGVIRLVLDTDGRDGPIDKRVTLYTNSVDVIRQTFQVRATIDVGLVAWPRTAVFPRTTKGKPSYVTIHLRGPADGPAWEVTAVKGTVKIGDQTVPYAWEVRPVKDARHRRVNVIVTNPGLDREGPFKDLLLVETTHPDRSQVKVRTSLQVVPPIVAVPVQASLGYLPTDRRVRVRLFPGPQGEEASFEIKGVAFERPDGVAASKAPPGFTATWARGEDGYWSIDVGYEGQPPRAGRTLRVMVVRTTHPEQPEIRIDCSARAEG